jgi:hypothetical protein
LDPNPAELRIIRRRADAMKMPLESSIDRIKLNSTNEEDEGAVSLRPEEKEAREDQTYDLGYLKKPRFALTGKTIKELKFSNKSDLSQEQIEALQEAWNHIRAGALDPEPVKKLEKIICDYILFDKRSTRVKGLNHGFFKHRGLTDNKGQNPGTKG